MLRTRLSSSSGQVAAEYLGGLLLVAVVIAALLGGQLHTKIAVEAERAICKITGSAGCGEPGVPKPEGADSDPGEPDREVHDAECDNDLPGRLLRDEGDDPADGDEEANQGLRQPRPGLRVLLEHVRPQLLRRHRRRPGRLDQLLRDAWHAAAQRLLERDPDGVRRRVRRGPRHHRPRAHARRHGGDRRPRVPVPVGRAQRVDVGHLRLQRRRRRLADRRGPAHRRAPRHGAPGERPSAAARARRRLQRDAERRQPFQRPRRRALQQRHPEPRVLPEVKAIGRDAAEAIVYRALTEELGSDSGFEDFRTASLAVAARLWGEDSPEYQGTNESFAAVGLDGTWEAPEVEGC
jgi:hypothetical protein